MRMIGLDIGTTTLSAVVFSDGGELLATRTEDNKAAIPAVEHGERQQDPRIIREAAVRILRDLLEAYAPVQAIGITGQMHGMLYLDARGNAVSPLFTWQDEQGNLPMQATETYAQALTARTGYPMATGFGGTTHFSRQHRGLVPGEARTFATIGAYLACYLTGREKPLLHASEAASFGLYDVQAKRFDASALAAGGLDAAFFPEQTGALSLVGHTRKALLEAEIPVCIALGDNQASFAGAVRDSRENILVNVGTGGQVSMVTDTFVQVPQCDTRPYMESGYLLCGAPLCAGSAYALLEQLFRQVAIAVGHPPEKHLYDHMAVWAAQYAKLPDPLSVDTTFRGTRKQPQLRGSIAGIGMDNFTPAHLVAGFLSGITQELLALYEEMKGQIQASPNTMVCAGNGVRLNAVLREMLGQAFQMQPVMPLYQEEAAIGAALCALRAVGGVSSLAEAQRLLRYQ